MSSGWLGWMGGSWLTQVLLRIPVGTVVWEEIERGRAGVAARGRWPAPWLVVA
jgi:hypothetical protein